MMNAFEVVEVDDEEDESPEPKGEEFHTSSGKEKVFQAPSGDLDILIERKDKKDLSGNVTIKATGPKEVEEEKSSPFKLQKLKPGDYTVSISPVGDEKNWRILREEPKDPDALITVSKNKTSSIKFELLPPYKEVQFIAFNIKPGTKEKKGKKVYLGSADAPKDISKRCTIMKSAIRTASKHPDIDKRDTVLKVFMAPEFYFRGREGGYPIENITGVKGKTGKKGTKDKPGIMDKLKEEIQEEKYVDWLFVFGTAIGYQKQDETISKITAVEFDKKNKNTIITVDYLSKPIENNSIIEQNTDKGIVTGKVTKCEHVGPADKKNYKITLNKKVNFELYDESVKDENQAKENRKKNIVNLKRSGGKTEIFNIALVCKGGQGTPVLANGKKALTEAIVYKEYVSGIDYIPSSTKGKSLIHGEDRYIIPTEQSGFGSEISDSGLGGGSVFTMEGITFGLEVCLDHRVGRLDQFYKGPDGTGKSKPQIHLIPSWGMSIGLGPICCLDNGLVFNVDGQRSDSVARINDGKYSCDNHPELNEDKIKTCKECNKLYFNTPSDVYYCESCFKKDPTKYNGGWFKKSSDKCKTCSKKTIKYNQLLPIGTSIDSGEEKEVELKGLKWFTVTQSKYFEKKGHIKVYSATPIP